MKNILCSRQFGNIGYRDLISRDAVIVISPAMTAFECYRYLKFHKYMNPYFLEEV